MIVPAKAGTIVFGAGKIDVFVEQPAREQSNEQRPGQATRRHSGTQVR